MQTASTPQRAPVPTAEQLRAWYLFVKFGYSDAPALVSALLRTEDGLTYTAPAPTFTEVVMGGDESWSHDGRKPIARNRAALRQLFGVQVLELAITESPAVIAAFGELLIWQRENVLASMPTLVLDAATDRRRRGLLDILAGPRRERAARLKEAADDVRVAADLIAKGTSHREALVGVEAHRMLEGLLHDMAGDLDQWAAYYAPLRSEVGRARSLTATSQETAIQAAVARMPLMTDLDTPEYWYPLLVAEATREEPAAARQRVRRALDGLLAEHPVEKITAEMIIDAIRADVGARTISLPSIYAAFTKMNPAEPIRAMDEWGERLMNLLENRPAPKLRDRLYTDKWDSLFYIAQPAGAPPFNVENGPCRTVQFRDGSPNNARILFADVVTNFALEDLVRYKELKATGDTGYSRVLPMRRPDARGDIPESERGPNRRPVPPLRAWIAPRRFGR